MKTRLKLTELGAAVSKTLYRIEQETGIGYTTLLRYDRGEKKGFDFDHMVLLRKSLATQTIDEMIEEVRDNWKPKPKKRGR
jgi:hypothetical protein